MSLAAHLGVPAGKVGDFGEDVAKFAADSLGRPLDAAQCEAVAAMTAYGPDGRWLALESAILMARQNGKTAGTVTPIVLWDLFTGEPDRIVWSAHLFKTTREAFDDHKALIGAAPALDRRVKRVATANGNESIELTDGSKIDYLARSKGGGRGLGGKRVVIDEALFWTGSQAGALLPVLAARPDPQIMYASSAAMAGEGSDYLRSLVARGRRGDASLAWVEHCAPGSFDEPGCRSGADCPHTVRTPGCVLDDERLWFYANPALDVRVTVGFLRKMRQTLPPVEFAREFLGWHEEPQGGSTPPITAEAWTGLVEVGSKLAGGHVVFAAQLSGSGKSACIAAAGRRADGLWHVEVIEDRPGVEWVVGRALELLARHPQSLLTLMTSGATGQLLPELLQVGAKAGVNVGSVGQDDGHRVEVLSDREHAAGCALLDTYVRERRLRHPADAASGEPDPRWALALSGAAKRVRGDGWVWSVRDSVVDPLHLVAATNALLGAVRRSDWSGHDPLNGFG